MQVISTEENPKSLSGKEKRLIIPHNPAQAIINNSPENFLILRKDIKFYHRSVKSI